MTHAFYNSYAGNVYRWERTETAGERETRIPVKVNRKMNKKRPKPNKAKGKKTIFIDIYKKIKMKFTQF